MLVVACVGVGLVLSCARVAFFFGGSSWLLRLAFLFAARAVVFVPRFGVSVAGALLSCVVRLAVLRFRSRAWCVVAGVAGVRLVLWLVCLGRLGRVGVPRCLPFVRCGVRSLVSRVAVSACCGVPSRLFGGLRGLVLLVGECVGVVPVGAFGLRCSFVPAGGLFCFGGSSWVLCLVLWLVRLLWRVARRGSGGRCCWFRFARVGLLGCSRGRVLLCRA